MLASMTPFSMEHSISTFELDTHTYIPSNFPGGIPHADTLTLCKWVVIAKYSTVLY